MKKPAGEVVTQNLFRNPIFASAKGLC